MSRFLLVCLGGAIGSGARYLVALWSVRSIGSGFPSGTLIVNIIGSFLLGIVMQLPTLSPNTRLLLATGVMGGFTTYSTFNFETLQYARQGAWAICAVYVVATFIGCILGGLAGLALGRAVAGAN